MDFLGVLLVLFVICYVKYKYTDPKPYTKQYILKGNWK